MCLCNKQMKSQIELVLHLSSYFVLLFTKRNLLIRRYPPIISCILTSLSTRRTTTRFTAPRLLLLFTALGRLLLKMLRLAVIASQSKRFAELVKFVSNHSIHIIKPVQRRKIRFLSHQQFLVEPIGQLTHFVRIIPETIQNLHALLCRQCLQQFSLLLFELFDIPLGKIVIRTIYYFSLPMLTQNCWLKHVHSQLPLLCDTCIHLVRIFDVETYASAECDLQISPLIMISIGYILPDAIALHYNAFDESFLFDCDGSLKDVLY